MGIAEFLEELNKLLDASRTLSLERFGLGWTVIMLLALILMLIFARKVAKTILTLRALAITPGFSRILSKWLRSSSYSEEEFLRADGAGEQWVKLRREALNTLA